MARGCDASDWIVSYEDDEGTVTCQEFRGRFRVQSSGVVQISWLDGPEPEDVGPVRRAAQEAIDVAVRPRG